MDIRVKSVDMHMDMDVNFYIRGKIQYIKATYIDGYRCQLDRFRTRPAAAY